VPGKLWECFWRFALGKGEGAASFPILSLSHPETPEQIAKFG